METKTAAEFVKQVFDDLNQPGLRTGLAVLRRRLNGIKQDERIRVDKAVAT